MAQAGTPQPLNPALLEALQRGFGRVRIVHPGDARVIRRGRRGQRLTVVQWGEEYAVNCPFCNDRGMRLLVSYEYGVADGEVPPKFHWDLIHCFAKQCHDDGLNILRFSQMVKEHGYRGRLYLRGTQRHA